MLGYNRTITPTNIRFAQHWARGGGGREKKEVKTATFPTLLTMYQVVLEALASRIFFSVLKSLANWPCSYAKDKGFFRGPNILDEGEEGGGRLQGHH